MSEQSDSPDISEQRDPADAVEGVMLRGSERSVSLTMPPAVLKLMSWSVGDLLLVYVDDEEKEVILRRAPRRE